MTSRLTAGAAIVVVVAVLAACAAERRAVTPNATTITPTTPSTTTPTLKSTTTTPTSTTAPALTAPAAAPVPPSPRTVADLIALGRPIVLAHTGGEDEFPGSTMFAFGESAKAGVDVLDLNVLLTADGVLVVQHDDTVERTSNGIGAVADLTYALVNALDNAYWFTAECTCTGKPDAAYLYRGVRTGAVRPPPGYAPSDFAVPRFRDVVDRFPDLPLNIEIKGTGAPAADAARKLAGELHDLHRADASIVTSFDDAAVEVFRQAAPDVEVTPGLDASAAWVLSATPLPAGMRILQLPPRFGDVDVLTAESIGRAHAAGYLIWVWPNQRELENPASYRAFLAEGIDGLNINFPADGVEAVRAFTAGGSLPATT